MRLVYGGAYRRAAVYATVYIALAAPAWAYDPCNGLRQAVKNMEATSDARLADYQQRLADCNAAADEVRSKYPNLVKP